MLEYVLHLFKFNALTNVQIASRAMSYLQDTSYIYPIDFSQVR